MPRQINTNRTSGSTTAKDGVYQLLIVESEEAVSKSSGNDMVVLTLQIIKGSKRIGREIKDYMVYPEEDLEEDEEDKYQWKFDQLHNALDVPEGKVIDYRYYKGKKIYAKLKTEMYGDNTNNKIDKYLPEDVAISLIEEQTGASMNDLLNEESKYEEDRTPVQAATAKRGRPAKQQVAELDDDDDLMPL
jgi:hypothetical protein